MELTLNLAWAVIAIASYALLFRRLGIKSLSHDGGPQRWQCVVALSCALLILFPVISLTDDLHEIQATAEEAASSAVVKRCAANLGPHPVRGIHQVHYLPAAMPGRPGWAVVGAAAILPVARPRPALQRPAPARAPPHLPAPFAIA